MPVETAHKPRKTPRQARSRATVEAILDACARVLVEVGYDRASTNRIAKVAGVSVGSLYQYFPSKEALVLALVERHTAHMLEMLSQSTRELADAPLPEAVRTYVRALLSAHAVEPKLHRVIVEQVLHLGVDRMLDLDQRFRALVRAYLEQHRDTILPVNLDAAAFVLVSAVQAISHRAVLAADNGLPRPLLEDELVALVLRYLLGESPSSSSRRASAGRGAGPPS